MSVWMNETLLAIELREWKDTPERGKEIFQKATKKQQRKLNKLLLFNKQMFGMIKIDEMKEGLRILRWYSILHLFSSQHPIQSAFNLGMFLHFLFFFFRQGCTWSSLT